MKSLKDYIQEQLDDNNNVLITEGKFWDWIKSLFRGKAKKYKKADDIWAESSSEAKKYNEITQKLNNEYDKKSKEIIDKITDKSSTKDVKQAQQELAKLSDKKLEVQKKIQDEYKETLDKAPDDVRVAKAIKNATFCVNFLIQWKSIFVKNVESFKSSIDDPNIRKKSINEQKKFTLSKLSEFFNKYFQLCYNDESDNVKKAFVNILKDSKTDKFFNISDAEILLNIKECDKMLIEAGNEKLKQMEENEKKGNEKS